jgi:hypothetical protein
MLGYIGPHGLKESKAISTAHLSEQPCITRQVGSDSPHFDGLTFAIKTQYSTLTAGRLEKAHQCSQQCRLACTIGTEQTKYLSPLHA